MAGKFLLTVRARVSPEKEAAFNDWYNTDHLVKMAARSEVVSARRYRATSGGDDYNYMAVYEFETEAALNAVVHGDFLEQMIREYDEAFGQHSQRVRTVWEQIFPE